MTARRFEVLDAWRGVCALLVALEHINIDCVLHRNALIHHGYRFVDFFFVLSGFVIAHAYRERLQRGASDVWKFLVRRVGRLWPLHAMVLLGFIGFEIAILAANHLHVPTGRAAFTEHDTLGSLPANLLLVHSWGFLHHPSWNVPSWSISTELLAYAAFAGICALFARTRAIDLVAALVLAGSAAVVIVAAPLGMRSTFDFGIFRCLFGFMTGVLVRRLWERAPLRVGTVGELVVLAIVGTAVILLPEGPAALLVTPAFALAIWVFASENGACSTALRGRIPRALGAWSYSLYMVHALILLVILTLAMLASRMGVHVFARVGDVATIVGSPVVTTAITFGYLACVIGIASLTYRFVELPGQRFFERFTGAKHVREVERPQAERQ